MEDLEPDRARANKQSTKSVDSIHFDCLPQNAVFQHESESDVLIDRKHPTMSGYPIKLYQAF